MLSGDGAAQFAQQQGLALVDNSYFDTEHRYQQLIKAKQTIRKSEQPEQQAGAISISIINTAPWALLHWINRVTSVLVHQPAG